MLHYFKRIRDGVEALPRNWVECALFRFDAVVETPRGTGASIGHRMDQRVACTGEVVQHLGWRREALADFAVRDDARHAVVRLQEPAQLL